jgi:hypothetical protein
MNNKYEYYEKKEEHIEAKEQRISINRRRKKKSFLPFCFKYIYRKKEKNTT